MLNYIKYRYSVKLQDNISGNIFDLSNAGVIENILWQTSINLAQPGKLEVLIKGDESTRQLITNNGSFIRAGVNNIDFFYGRINKIELVVDALEGSTYRITAYDSIILLKSKENIMRNAGVTASDFFISIMRQYSERGLQGRVIESSKTPLKPYYFINESLYNIFLESMADSHIGEAGAAQFIIRDNLGTIEFRELRSLRTDYILGDESFTSGYAYNANIDESYNIVKVIRPNEETGMIEVWQVFDSNNINLWGYKQLTVEAEEHQTESEIRELAHLYLEAFNREMRDLRLQCIGINYLQAGDGIQFRASRGAFDHYLAINECVHSYSSDSHMMDLSLKLY